MTRRIYVYCHEQKKVVPLHERKYRGTSTEVIPDIHEFLSPIDGSMITSRSDLRRHNREHGVVQIGNDIPREHFAKRTINYTPAGHATARELGEKIAEGVFDQR